jgi:hypothetical protein
MKTKLQVKAAKKWFESLTEDQQDEVALTVNSKNGRINWFDVVIAYVKEIDKYTTVTVVNR